MGPMKSFQGLFNKPPLSVDKFGISTNMSSKNFKDDILKYLMLQNRPYSVNDIAQHFGKDISKINVQKALDELTEEEWVIEKVYGKQKVYAPKQYDEINDVHTAISEIDGLINEASSELAKSEQELKSIESELKRYGNEISTSEAQQKLEELKENVKQLEEKVLKLSDSGIKISDDDKKKIMKQNEVVVREYKKRKRICMEIANSILENYPKPKRAFYEEVGIELDADVSR